MRCRQLLVALTVAFLAAPSPAPAADFSAFAPYVGDDVVAAVTIDLERLDAAALVQELDRLKLVPDHEVAEAISRTAAYQTWHNELVKRGARRLLALVRINEIADGGPTWLVEVASPQQAQPVAEWLASGFEAATPLGDVAKMFPRKFAIDGTVVIGAANQERLANVQGRRKVQPRADALAALADVGDADVAAVVFGDADSRRVLRELFPTMPAPFAEIDGKLLADGIEWVAATVKLPPDGRLTFAIETASDQWAATLRQSADKSLIMLKGLALAASINPPDDLPISGAQLVQAVDMLTPHFEGARLSITLGDNAEELAILQELAGKPIQQAREAAYRSQRMNNFKQIALAMHNFESANKTFPAAASYDAKGQTLLSWRVHILPYLEQGTLYKEFHLDEPWDSEHNRKLIDRMPELYADPDSAVRAAIGDRGKTTYLVPVGEGLVFGGKEGQTIRAIKDGTSNTVLLVEVVPERAVTWTQPADWEVDKNDSLAGVRRNDRDMFAAGWCDGHVKTLSNSIKPEVLWNVLTAAGGETVNHEELR